MGPLFPFPPVVWHIGQLPRDTHPHIHFSSRQVDLFPLAEPHSEKNRELSSASSDARSQSFQVTGNFSHSLPLLLSVSLS